MFKLKKTKRVEKVKLVKKPSKLRLALRKISNFKLIRKPLNGLKSFGGYLKGSWQELKLVRWPNRKATWSLTFAVLLFSLIFIVIIILLDVAFKELFNLILK